jgi:hypothetical protein
MSEVQIIGQDRINAMLRQLNEFDSNKAVKAGIRKGVNLLRRAGIKRLKERMKNPAGVTGNLLKVFQVKVKKNKLGGLAGFGMVTDSQGGKIKAMHAYIVDAGTDERSRGSKGSTGKMPALHYWTDTRDADMGGAIDEVLRGTEEAIIKIMT